MRTYGNLAAVPKTRPRTRRVTRKVIRKTGLPVKEKLLYLGTVIAFVLLTSWVLSQQAEFAKINYRIQEMEKQTAQLEAEITTLEAEEKKLLEPARIKRIAEEQGMSFNPARIVTRQDAAKEKAEETALNNS